jgi:hypothetical protein
MILAGFPATMTPAGTLLETTLPAPITEPWPILTPFNIRQFMPIKTSSSIVMAAVWADWGEVRLNPGSTGWKSVS